MAARVPLLLTVLCLSACRAPDDSPPAEGTLGEEGRVQFEWSQGCFFGCPLEQPLLTGSTEVIDVDGPGDDDGVTARSTDPAVVDVATERACRCERDDGRLGSLDIDRDASCPASWQKRCDNTFLVAAGQAGTAKIELVDAKGALVDRAPITVHDASTSRFFATVPARLGEQEGTAMDLAVGDRAALRVELYDTDGLALLAPEGVHWTTSDETVAWLSAFTFGAGADVTAGLGIDVEARAAGTATITLAVPGLTAVMTTTVR